MAVKRGAFLVCELLMPMQGGTWELAVQHVEQTSQSLPLVCRLGVFWGPPILGDPTDIADSDAVGIMPFAVSPYHCKRPSCMADPITVNHIVIANGLEALLAMNSGQLLYAKVLPFGRCRAMDDDFVNPSHKAA